MREKNAPLRYLLAGKIAMQRPRCLCRAELSELDRSEYSETNAKAAFPVWVQKLFPLGL